MVSDVVSNRVQSYWNKRGRSRYVVDGEPYYTGTPLPLHRRQREATLELIAERVTGQVLDYGCGDGYMLSVLGAQNPDVEFFGCDINDSLLAYPIDNYMVTKNGTIPFDLEFDLIYSVSVFQHIQSDKEALVTLADLRSHLTGELIVCDSVAPQTTNHAIFIERSREDYLWLLEEAGFRVEFEKLIAFPFARKMQELLLFFVREHYGDEIEANKDPAFRELFETIMSCPQGDPIGSGKLFVRCR